MQHMATATKRSPAGLALAEKRKQVVALRLEGKTLESIASAVGLAGDSSVRYHLDAWLAEQKPSSEQTEELRQFQAAQIDAIAERLWPGLSDPELALPTTDRLVKLMDRKARLMGLDLQQGISVTILTREGLARAMDWDPLAIEGTAEEVPDADA